MQITASIQYAATPELAFEMLTDEAFLVRKCELTGALNQTAHSTPEGDGATTVTKRTVSTSDFPDFARSLLGETIIITETTVWSAPEASGRRTGTLTVDLGSAPISLNGRLLLEPTAENQTHESVTADLKAKLPFIGGKIEKAAEPAVMSAIKHEEEAGREWLAAR